MGGVAMSLSTCFVQVSPYPLLVQLISDADPNDAEWSAYEMELGKVSALGESALLQVRQLVVSDGGGPNAAQRKSLQAFAGGRPVRVAVVSNALSNPIKLGIITAVSWFNPQLRAVPPDQWSKALSHLDLSNDESVWRCLERLQALPEQPKNATLARIAGVRQSPRASVRP